MNAAEDRAALIELVNAIEEHVERRVLLDKRRPGERCTQPVVLMRDINHSYLRARQALHRAR